MDKLKQLIKKYKSKEVNDKKKIENLVFFLVMLVIVVIGINMILGDNDKKEDIQANVKLSGSNDSIVTNGDNSLTNHGNEMEQKLSTILEKVNGVSNVSVMVTFENNEEISPIYNIEQGETITKETDTSGGTRDITQKEYNKQIIFEEKDNNKSVVIEKTATPKISGIIVVANFNNDLILKQEIIKAVSSVANISEYKVQVLSSK